jgi:hypothetical protein
MSPASNVASACCAGFALEKKQEGAYDGVDDWNAPVAELNIACILSIDLIDSVGHGK